MARFDLYLNSGGRGYLLDVQSDWLGGLNTRVVVPLLPREESPEPADRLDPVFEIDGDAVPGGNSGARAEVGGGKPWRRAT